MTGQFSEKDFYLEEFRGRSIALAVPRPELVESAPLERVLAELAPNRTRVLLVSADRVVLEKWGDHGDVVEATGDEDGWVGPIWRGLRAGRRVGLKAPDPATLAEVCRRLALRLRLSKLVWIDDREPMFRADGSRLSYVDLPALDRILTSRPDPLLAEIRTLLAAGFPSVNLCTAEGLERELFTYSGSGTLFTRERYTEVRSLGLDDLDTANDLIVRGVEEGYLVPRSPEQLEAILSHSFGMFVEGRFMAGIGALIPHTADNAGELASLYTVTRFIGEGVGSHLVRHALGAAREGGFEYVFACTTSESVRGFFERNGFRLVDHDRVPAEKWQGYDEARRSRVHCLRFEL